MLLLCQADVLDSFLKHLKQSLLFPDVSDNHTQITTWPQRTELSRFSEKSNRQILLIVSF